MGRRVGRAVVLSVLSAALVALGSQWLLHQSFLRVQHVVVTGTHHESAASVRAASGLDGHPPMIDVRASALSARLGAFPWIRGVSVVKQWPSTVLLAVRERTPVAVAFTGTHSVHYVDAAGHDLGPAPFHVNLPTLEFSPRTGSAWPFERAGHGAALVASRLPRAFAAQVSVISEDAQGVVTLKLTTPVRFILGPATDLEAKFVSVASVIAHSHLHAGDVVDVSVPGTLAVTGPPPS